MGLAEENNNYEFNSCDAGSLVYELYKKAS
jgi:hypothetical protein